MVSKRLIAGLVLLLSVGAARPARADGYQEWLNICGGTSFITCASVKVWVTGTVVKLHIWNLAANNAAYNAATGYEGGVFTQIALLNIGGAVASPTVTAMSGPYYSTGGAPTKWNITDTNADGQGTLAAGTTGGVGLANGIASNCSASGPNLVPTGTKVWMNRTTACGSAWTTSGSSLKDYAVEMTFNVNQTFDPGLHGMGIGITAVDMSNTSVTSYQAVYATPEPATMLLLGTGLLGVAGAARRRRRERTLADLEDA